MASYKHEVPPPQQQQRQQRDTATRYESEDALRQALGVKRTVTVDVEQFVRTRDALTSAYMTLSHSIDLAVKAYITHTQTLINGDGLLDATLLLEPFNTISQTAQQVAQQALRAQGNDSIDPQLLQNGQNGQAAENGDGKKKRKKRAYKQRDPNAPKRPLTAYFRFLGEKRPQIMEEVKKDPTKFEEAGKPGDISRIATKRWNALTEAQQLPYKQAYQDALKGYEKEVEEYKKAGGVHVDDSKIDIDGPEIDPQLTADADADAEGEEDEDVSAGASAAAQKEDDTSDDSSESDTDEESEESDDEPAPPPKPTKKAAATPKSALKKSAKQAQTFSSIPEPPAQTPVPTKEASPAKKRKAAAEPEEPAKSNKKKSRKSTVTAGADPVPSPAPAPVAAPIASSPPVSDKAAKKARKDKKKRKGSAGEA